MVGSHLFVVTTTADNGDDTNPPKGYLRQAISNANDNPPAPGTQNQILFNIPGTGPFTITLLGLLPEITTPVVLDGTSQPGYAGSPIIAIDGRTHNFLTDSMFGFSGDGLVLAAGSGGSTIEDLTYTALPQRLQSLTSYREARRLTSCPMGTSSRAIISSTTSPGRPASETTLACRPRVTTTPLAAPAPSADP